MKKKTVKTQKAKPLEMEANQFAVPVGTTDSTKLALSLTNVGLRLRELESHMANLATNNQQLFEKLEILEKQVWARERGGVAQPTDGTEIAPLEDAVQRNLDH